MNKQQMIELMKQKDSAYFEFYKKVKEKTNSLQWGVGVTPPYSLEPYRFELLGNKPGKMLKKPSSPGKNRHCYFYDNQDRIIHAISYASLGGSTGNKSWIHNDDFYEYHDNSVIRYVYSGVFESGNDNELDRVVFIEINDGLITKTYELDKLNFEYMEAEYFYENNKIIYIDFLYPDSPVKNNKFKLIHEPNEIQIIELRNGIQIQIYP
ncbi:hypothetical protein [Flavobacterium sp. 22076]|uniref:hypothetical protein n=1 Tax=unclassified Flavobacterium TaxID=196869 RepID=UPI003F86EE85